MSSQIHKLLLRSKFDQIVWRFRHDMLTILTYHGVCPDRLAREPWVPSCFVTESEFREQLDYIAKNCCVLPLSQAVTLLRRCQLPERAVCITFDDGYANNLRCAMPILRRKGFPVTVFIATSYVQTGEFFPFDRMRLVRSLLKHQITLPDHKHCSIDEITERLIGPWAEIEQAVTPEQREVLRPLSVHELRLMAGDHVEFGGHTHSHCILANEAPEKRESEIRTCLSLLRHWTASDITLFSYPNGQPGDMGEQDRQVLLSEGVKAAVTTIPGTNKAAEDPMFLKRFPVGLFHDAGAFASEISGARALMRRVARADR